MWQNLKIGRRPAIGIGAMLAVATSAQVGPSAAEQSFAAFDQAAKETAIAGKLNGDLMAQRLYHRVYSVKAGDEAELRGFDGRSVLTGASQELDSAGELARKGTMRRNHMSEFLREAGV